MLTERLIFILIALPVLLVTAYLFCAAPLRAVPALRSSSSEVRLRAKWLLGAWVLFIVLLVAYFLSGFWYRENIVIRPVDPLEVFELVMILLFGVHLPSVAYGRLNKARKKALAAENG
jgi:hypothetical protein